MFQVLVWAAAMPVANRTAAAVAKRRVFMVSSSIKVLVWRVGAH